MTLDLVLPARLDTKAAPDLAEKLAGADDGAVSLDASGVSFLGALCLEHLLAAATRARAAGAAFDLADPSLEMTDTLALLGLTADDFGTGAAA